MDSETPRYGATERLARFSRAAISSTQATGKPDCTASTNTEPRSGRSDRCGTGALVGSVEFIDHTALKCRDDPQSEYVGGETSPSN
ncbi:hypothetical protein D3C78_1802390 [compost metagenome]